MRDDRSHSARLYRPRSLVVHFRKPLLVNLALVVASILLATLVAEGVLRVVEHVRRIPIEDGQVRLDRLNYNDTSVPLVKASGELRILSLGDSFAYSVMKYPYSYAGIVGRTLTDRLHRPVRVVNLGEPNTSILEYLASYEYWAPVVHADGAIIDVYLGNDVLDTPRRNAASRWTPNRLFDAMRFNIADGTTRHRIPHEYSLRLLDHAYAAYLSLVAIPPPVIQPDDDRFNVAQAPLPEKVYYGAHQRLLANFDFSRRDLLVRGYRSVVRLLEFAKGERARGRLVLISLAPSETQVDAELRARVVQGAGKPAGAYDWRLPSRIIMRLRDRIDDTIPIVDLTPAFACHAARGERLYHPLNTHWGLEGNLLAAREIAAAIERDWFAAPREDDADCVDDPPSEYAVDARAIDDFVGSILAADH